MKRRNTLLIIFQLYVSFLTAQISSPKNLDEAIVYFKKTWTKERLTKFKKLSEQEATASTHFTTGLWIRNNWIRGDRNPPLIKYFESIGLINPDDISAIIILSLHRTLNNRNLEIEKQVAEYKSYWDKIHNCDNRLRQKAVEIYNKFKVGDKITIYMPVDISDKQRNAVTYSCPEPEWVFNPKKDLKMNCTITDKYIINSETNVFFKIRIDKMNFKNTKVYMNAVKINEIISIHLSSLRVE
jgi:hypothetical protein